MSGRLWMQRGVRGLALGGVMILMSGCETEYRETVVVTAPPPTTYEVVTVEEVIVETEFVVVDEYGVVVEEVEVTWETISSAPQHQTTSHYYAAARRVGDKNATVPLPANQDDEILFRFSKPGYVDVWASSADMEMRTQGDRVVLEHKVVLAKR